MKGWLSSLLNLSEDGEYFSLDVTDDGIDFYCSESLIAKTQNGEAGELMTAQYIALQMLVEEGEAESIPNGFIIGADVLARLSEDLSQLLKTPPIWGGKASVDIKGTTGGETFHVDILVESPSGRKTAVYKLQGNIIMFGDTQFSLAGPMYEVFKSQAEHQQSNKNEYDNLLFLHKLQAAQSTGAKIELSQFDKINIHVPKKIAVDAELDRYGNLILTPSMGQDATHDELQRVLGQLQAEQTTTLKVNNEIILFDEKTADAAREIITNRAIPRSQVKQFLETPAAFLDASLVDLDVGFAIRVRGATRFKHAYFGETDESGIDWFGQSQNATILPFSAITKAVKTQEDLQTLTQRVADARATGAAEVMFDEKNYDIGSQSDIDQTLTKLKAKFERGIIDDDPIDDDTTPSPTPSPDDPDEDVTIVVDIDLNDDSLDSGSKLVEEALNDVIYSGTLNWDNHKRTPFPHQDVGVKWILGLEEKARKEQQINGALLADDMGLGKTFMSLSAIEHYYRLCEEYNETCRPTLIVAPLSLLENWKDEVTDTFHTSPFKDIVILQSDGELNNFREGGIEIKGNNIEEDDFEIRYSLKFGEKYGSERLDLPKRLVITTYQTLRDYQFSLSQIDWGVVVFDEAQNIKNPNALQTRAAKGLKAKFKLLATGTPVENSLADFWCLMDTACPGYLDSYQVFRKTYITPILQAAGDEIENVRAHLGRKLREHVGHLMLRRVKEDNLKGLPKKRMYVGVKEDNWKYYFKLEAMMSGYQQKVYEGTIEAQMNAEDSHVLTTLMRLRDSSLHPRLADGGRLDAPKSKKEITQLFEESIKLYQTIEVLQEIKARGEKCIIFAVNKRLQRFLSASLTVYFGLSLLHVINGDAKAVAKRKGTLSRKGMIADFESKDGFNIIIMSPVAAGVGLTVVGANNVIHFERHWNPAKEAQATDRVYRIGQKKDVNIYVPILHHPSFESFDVNLHKLLSQKSMLKDAVVTPGEVVPNPTGSDKHEMTPDSVVQFDDVQRLSWKQFEALCVELLAKEYKADSAWLTKDGSDLGADGIVVSGDNAVLIQAKHKSGSYKGHSAVQEIAQASEVYGNHLGRKITQKVFMTNATTLAKASRELADELNVTVIDGNSIEQLCEQHQITYAQVLGRLSKQRYVIR